MAHWCTREVKTWAVDVQAGTARRPVYQQTVAVRTRTESWPRLFKQIPKIFRWILRGQAASAEGRGSESKYTTSGVRACRLECGLRVL